MPAVQTCGVDIDDENQGKSWNEGIKNGRDSLSVCLLFFLSGSQHGHANVFCLIITAT